MRLLSAVIVLVVLPATVHAATGRGSAAAGRGSFAGLIELTVDGRKLEGMPLSFDRRSLHLLGRDGRLWEVATAEASNPRKASNRFRPYNTSQLRAELLRELGREFEVTGTSHFMVAHRRGQRDQWANRFEKLYRSFVHYFAVRGLRVKAPTFPLVGVVFPDARQFHEYHAAQGTPLPWGVLGYYDPTSNRIALYDRQGQFAGDAWHETAKVIIHEATHQTAFNTGIHSRYARPPLWVAEGLATMFEAPGVYNSRAQMRPSDRINLGRLRAFRQGVRPKHRAALLTDLVASDRLFRISPSAAYAEAWALTTLLVETRPTDYAKYLAATAKRPAFSEYSAKERLADFTAVFGDDWQMLEARLLRFIDALD